MTDEEINQGFQNLVAEFEDIHRLIETRPLLAHYTSISTIESIMKTNELWFSNPLFMNDLQEMRYGLHEGMTMLLQSDRVQASCGTIERAALLKSQVSYYFNEFDNKHALDTYVFCLSEHKPSDLDGRLSMWRAYGGQGNGAALVFNTSFIMLNATSPLLIAKVNYKSPADRQAWLNEHLEKYLMALSGLSIPDDKLFIAAFQIFNLFKIFSLTFKHDGFAEEQEWRVIYMPDRDVHAVLTDRFSYHISSRGVEPKLKIPVEPLKTPGAPDWTFESIVEQIILGPSVSSPLAKASINRMLEKLHKPGFVKKVVSSKIPLRAAIY